MNLHAGPVALATTEVVPEKLAWPGLGATVQSNTNVVPTRAPGRRLLALSALQTLTNPRCVSLTNQTVSACTPTSTLAVPLESFCEMRYPLLSDTEPR